MKKPLSALKFKLLVPFLRVGIIVFGFAFLSIRVVYALPLGNPSEASLLRDGVFYEPRSVNFCDPCADWTDVIFFRVGFYGDYVLNRNLEVHRGVHKSDLIEQFELTTNAGYFVFNVCDRFDLFIAPGVTNMRVNTNAASFRGVGSGVINGDRLEIVTESRFSWSFGAHATIYGSKRCAFGIEGQYFYTKPDIRRISSRKTVSVNPLDTVQMKYEEWQVGIGFSYRIGHLVPYLGAKWSAASVDVDHALIVVSSNAPVTNVQLEDLVSRFNGGYVVGLSLVDCEKVSLTLEARYPDEKAIYFNAQLRL